MKGRASEPLMDSEVVFERIFREHYLDVLAYARRRTSADGALDVVADTFLTAWRRFDAVPADPLPWLLAVARGALANQSRADRRRDALKAKARVFEHSIADSPEASSDQVALAALAALSPTEREAILLVAWEGLTPRQAAASLGCSSVAFRARLSRARRRLRTILGDKAGEARSPHALANPREEPS